MSDLDRQASSAPEPPEIDTDDCAHTLVLAFSSDGIAEFSEDDELIWTSDDDENYHETHLTVADAAELLTYLESQELLEEDEKGDVRLESEPLVLIQPHDEHESIAPPEPANDAPLETYETPALPPTAAARE